MFRSPSTAWRQPECRWKTPAPCTITVHTHTLHLPRLVTSSNLFQERGGKSQHAAAPPVATMLTQLNFTSAFRELRWPFNGLPAPERTHCRTRPVCTHFKLGIVHLLCPPLLQEIVRPAKSHILLPSTCCHRHPVPPAGVEIIINF